MIKNIRGEISQSGDMTFERILEFYKKINFIYPSKEEAMSPYFSEISDVWEKLLRIDDDVFVFFHKLKDEKLTSSVCAAQYTDKSWLIQHATGDHDTRGVHENLVSLVNWMIENPSCDNIRFLYRPDNVWPKRIFGSFMETLSPDLFEYSEKGYFIGEFKNPLLRTIDDLVINPVRDEDKESFKKEIEKKHGMIFLESKGLMNPEEGIIETSRKYESAGLWRKRDILLAKKKGRMMGYSLLDYSPLGINFSFFFNAFTMKMFENDDSARRGLAQESINYYVKKGRQFTVCLAEPQDERTLLDLGMHKKKEYAEFLLSKREDGFHILLKHFNNFYKPVRLQKSNDQ